MRARAHHERNDGGANTNPKRKRGKERRMAFPGRHQTKKATNHKGHEEHKELRSERRTTTTNHTNDTNVVRRRQTRHDRKIADRKIVYVDGW